MKLCNTYQHMYNIRNNNSNHFGYCAHSLGAGHGFENITLLPEVNNHHQRLITSKFVFLNEFFFVSVFIYIIYLMRLDFG